MKKAVVVFVQYAVGILFIFSGMVKMNDPVGFSFKLEEYFSPPVLNMPVFEPVALPIAIILVIAEVLLGAALLLGLWKRLTLILLTAMIVFFTFLTFYSAYFNVVTDCGCFGDAIPLTPWESFGKDVILTVLILILWWGRAHIFDAYPGWMVRIKIIGVPAFCVAFTWYVLNHLPAVDFRPYAKGLSIIEGMKPAEELGLQPPQYDVVYTMENATGEQVEITGSQYSAEKWWEKKDWKMLSELSRTVKISEGYEPPVHDFSITTDYGDLTDSILSMDNVWLLISYNEGKSSSKGWEKVVPHALDLSKNGQPVFLLSASMPEDFLKYNLPNGVIHGFTDETTLKTMVRSNPGWVQLSQGTVANKLHFNDSPR